jgi:hypothetical protein
MGIRTLQPISGAAAPLIEPAPTRQRPPADGPPSPPSPGAVPPEAHTAGPRPTTSPPSFPWRDAGEVAVQALIAQRQPDGSVVFSVDGAGAPGIADGPETSDADAVQRAATDDSTAMPATPATAPSTTSAPPTATPASTSTPAIPADGAELDELAKRLYGRLRVMLKHELRLDRERAGSLIQRR